MDSPNTHRRRPSAHRPPKRGRIGVEDRGRFGRRAVTPVVLAIVVVLVGLPTSLGQAVFVSVNGLPVAVTPGTTLGDLVSQGGLTSRAGALVDVAGDVLVSDGGEAGSLQVNGAAAVAPQPIREGDRIVTSRGKDKAEPLERRDQTIPYEVRTEGSGPVVSMAQTGKNGTKAVYAGRTSDRVILTYVAAQPVSGVVRRSGALSPGQKAVALTFDDGPSPYTPQVLDILAAKGVRATFFMIGKSAAGNQGLVNTVRAEGHEVANHGWSHADLKTLAPDAVKAEISKGSSVLGGTRYLRPAYGSYNAQVIEIADSMGQRLTMWSVDTQDWKTRDAASILQNVKQQTSSGAIILMHDGGGDRSATVAALPAVIDWLLGQGYAITTVGRLAG